MTAASSRNAADLDVRTARSIIAVLDELRERGPTATYSKLHSNVGDGGIRRVCEALIEARRPTETPCSHTKVSSWTNPFEELDAEAARQEDAERSTESPRSES